MNDNLRDAIRRYAIEVWANAKTVDPDEEHPWDSLALGFLLGCGIPRDQITYEIECDLATGQYDKYLGGTMPPADDGIGNLKVKGDRATFKVKDIVGLCDDQVFHVAEDVGYGSITDIAKVIMDHVAARFGVKVVRSYVSEDREGGWLMEFEPAIPPERWIEYNKFLGHEP